MCNVIHTKNRFSAVFSVSKPCYEKRRFCKRVEKILQACPEHSYKQSDVSMSLGISG